MSAVIDTWFFGSRNTLWLQHKCFWGFIFTDGRITEILQRQTLQIHEKTKSGELNSFEN